MKRFFIICICTIIYAIGMAQIGQTFDTWDRFGENEISCKIISDEEVMIVSKESYKKVVKMILPETVINHSNGKTYTLIEIGDRAFYGNKNLTEISLPNTLKKIGEMAFASSGLVSITIPDNVDEIGGGCFTWCYNLKSVKLPKGIKELKSTQSDNYGFFEACYLLDSVSLPKTINKIGPACFSSCKNLRKIVIPEDVEVLPSKLRTTHLYDGCFSDCENLEEIVIGNHFKEFGCCCFDNCPKLKKVVGPFHCEIKYGEEDIIIERSIYNPSGGIYERNAFSKSGFNEKFDSIKKTFSFFAEPKIKRQIEDWQQKKAYETIDQWKTRVTESSRNNKLKEVIAQVQNFFINEYAPRSFSGSLGDYDADYQAYPISFKNMESIYVKVPQNIAVGFKEQWNKISQKASPIYGVVNNHLQVIYCSFKYKGKEYGLAQTYRNDDVSNLALNLSPLQLDLGNENNQTIMNTPIIQIDNSLDLNIPSASFNNTTTFAVIIGNERYTRVAQVPYANNDARIFAEYCKKTLGLPDKNVRSYENATFGTMLSAVNDIKKIAEAYQGKVNVIFYYAGHGVPNEQTHDAFLLPVDADGKQTEACYPVSRLYKELGGMNAKNVVVFMDACFSGSQRGEGMLASARGVALKAKAEAPQGNMVVFTAATGDETAYPYKEKGHGMFTYFLLKKLQETKGDCTLGELGEYIQTNVSQQSVVINRKSQTPTIVPSEGMMDSWRGLKLR